MLLMKTASYALCPAFQFFSKYDSKVVFLRIPKGRLNSCVEPVSIACCLGKLSRKLLRPLELALAPGEAAKAACWSIRHTCLHKAELPINGQQNDLMHANSLLHPLVSLLYYMPLL